MAKQKEKKQGKVRKKTSLPLDRAKMIAELCMRVADDTKAENIMMLKISEVAVLCDYFVICTGNSSPQLSSITDHIVKEAREKAGIKPHLVDGNPLSKWIVIDFGSVIVHIFSPEMRERYQLENVWGDAPRILCDLTEKRMKNRKNE